MRQFSISLTAPISSLWTHRSLIWALTKREVAARYTGSVLGLFWSFFTPLVMLLVYTFVFSVVFNARWSVSGESRTEFALMLFAGLMVFNIFAECVSRAPSLIISNANYVKKVVFPLEILPFVVLGSALFHFAISLLVWLAAYAFLFETFHLTTLLLPMVLLPFILLVLGFAWFLSATGVFLRDVGQVIGVLVSVMMFLAPIFYPITALPDEYRQWLLLNPLTPVIEWVRALLFTGASLPFVSLALFYLLSITVCWLGFVWFQKTRRGFADVL